MTNLDVAIEKALKALEPHVREVTKQRKVKGKTVTVVIKEIETIPAVVGPLNRRILEVLVEAAMKYNDSLVAVKELTQADMKYDAIMKRQQECAYQKPCKQCIHPTCGSYGDNPAFEEAVP